LKTNIPNKTINFLASINGFFLDTGTVTVTTVLHRQKSWVSPQYLVTHW